MPSYWNNDLNPDVKACMANKLKKTVRFLLQPKAVILWAAVFLLIYVHDSERRVIEVAGCYDCWWDTRQALLLLIASLGLLTGRAWSVGISLAAALKVIYSIGSVACFNNVAEAQGGWRTLKASLAWTREAHPEYFVEIAAAALIAAYSAAFIRRRIFRRSSPSGGGI